MVEHTTKRKQITRWTLTNEKYVDPLQRRERERRGGGGGGNEGSK